MTGRMTHVTEEQLILHYYGEPEDTGAVASHLESCDPCRDEYRRLQLVLNAVDIPVPQRDSAYEAHLWNQLAPRLGRGAWLWWVSPRRLAAAGAFAGLLLAAFLLGRLLPGSRAGRADVATAQPAVRERVLLVAVGDHLERTQIMLVELVNAPERGPLDISGQRELAENLVESNRLFRQTALAAGEDGMADVLDEIERVLLEIAHSPSELSAAQLDRLRRRIESEGLLFKVRVVESRVRERQVQPPAKHVEGDL